TLSSNRMDITRFSILGAGGRERGGSLTLTGHATWAPPPATPTVSLQARAERLNVSARADRRLTVSGDVTASLAQHTLHLRGKLKADQAQFTLPDDTAPTLGPDVIVRLNRANAPPPPVDGLRTDVAVDVDLGSAFDLRGQGLQTQLTGQLRISSPPGSDTFSVTGEVRAANGTYKAYGQLLRIEEGVLRFSGPYDDPSLAILALRGSANPARANFGNDTQKVGVKVSGSARSPQLQLYADPELPDSEKLAWLVLGRPASGAGAEAAVMQQAAMALLGSQVRGMEGGLAHALGLDDVSVSQDTGNATTTPGTAVTLGKRLSSRLYVAYEHSLSSAAGALNLYYDVSRRLTVRAQVGGDNALDLIFTLPYD
ncbi:MAG: translocation/assembly module TamB domain-containing protein, partial [Burkholderiales bacterium]|nr:translocation/assembly module TamB domain-containing protein [Burkholderiales bacterium]